MARPERRDELLGRGDGIVGQADAPSEHVRRAAGQDRQRGARAGDAGGHLVDGAVATEGHDHIDAAARRVLREAGGVAAPAGLDDLHVVLLRQRLVDEDGVAGGDRRGERVDDEQEAHETSTVVPVRTAACADSAGPGRQDGPVWPRW